MCRPVRITAVTSERLVYARYWKGRVRTHSKKRAWSTDFTIAAPHANHPRDRMAIRETFVLKLSCSFQIKGIGKIAKRTSVRMFNMESEIY